MAKVIGYIEPVQFVSGNLSANQRLAYADNNNDAYYSPVGKRNVARNYRAKYIGMKDKETGRTRFAVRDRHTMNMTTAAKNAMALMGATASIYSVLLKSDQAQAAKATYNYMKEQGFIEPTMSMRQMYSRLIRTMLLTHRSDYQIHFAGLDPVIISNIFVEEYASMVVPTNILVKFFDQLNPDPISFTVNGVQGIATAGMVFQNLIASNWNVLGLEGTGNYIYMNGVVLMDSLGRYPNAFSTIIPNEKYMLVSPPEN